MQKTKYLTNKELLAEIHRSKTTYCYYADKQRYSRYDTIHLTLDEVNEETALAVIEKKNSRPRRAANANDPVLSSPEDLVFRVMTYEHVPLCGEKKRRSRASAGEGHLRVNFPPFKHYVLREGKPVEVGRSHWKGDLETGEFSQEHGKTTDALAIMYMLLVERYGRRANWRGYTYIDEMKSSALLQLSANGLLFDESKSDNPFAFYTTTIQHSFTRVYNVERKNQNIRDDLLIIAGAKPSFTRQVEHEMAQKAIADGTVPAKPIPAKRGRKPKKVVEAAAAADAAREE